MIKLTMILQCKNADEGCGLPGDEGTIGKRCGKSADEVAGTGSLSEGAVYDKGKVVISTVGTHDGSGTNRTGSTRRRSRTWIHLDRSYG
jgi:hypothetical protein